LNLMTRPMRLTTVYYALALLLVTTAAIAEPFAQSSVTSTTLDNGLKVIVLEDHTAELVALDVWVKAGNVYETKSNNGVAHFIEHLLFKGTARRTEGQADREIESLGSSLDASTTRDGVRIDTVVASKYFDVALDVLTDVTMRAKLDQQSLERERPIILDEISRRDADPFRALAGLVAKASFENHPYGWPLEGSTANVTAMTVEQVRAFYDTYFVPNNMAVIVVGDVNAAKALESVKKAFSEFKKKDVPPLQTPVEPPLTAIRKERATRSTKITYCALSFPSPSIKDTADVYGMDVLVQYLSNGYQSWLESLKSPKAEVQAVSGDFLTRRDPGNVMLMFGVDAIGVEDVRQAILTKLKQLKGTPLPAADIAAAKRSIEGSYAFETETVSGRANILGFYEALGDYKLALSYVDNVRKVTPEQAMQTAAKYFNTDSYVIAEVGP
jgi:zinc protease